jgi:hypothetical protein
VVLAAKAAATASISFGCTAGGGSDPLGRPASAAGGSSRVAKKSAALSLSGKCVPRYVTAATNCGSRWRTALS